MTTVRSLLIVDDDLGTREIFGAAFKLAGMRVQTADSGANALVASKAQAFDLMLLDFRLPGMNGIEVVRRLRDERRSIPFVLITAFPTVDLAVDAMKLGALDVLQKPLEIDDLIAKMRPLFPSAISESHGIDTDVSLLPVTRPRSVAARWAGLVLHARHAEEDLKTIGEWARFVGVSYTSLCEVCRLLKIPPHRARDFARLLRATIRAVAGDGRLESSLYVSDSRTLKRLLDLAGCDSGTKSFASADEFIERQRFIPIDNAGVSAVRTALSAAR